MEPHISMWHLHGQLYLVTYSAQEPKTWFLKCLMIETKHQMGAMFKVTQLLLFWFCV